MFNIQILTNDFHTFHPYFKEKDEFKKRGINIYKEQSNDTDLVLIGHSLFQDKKVRSLDKSTEKGLEFLKSIDKPYILVDGQDSHSLIGTFEVFKDSDAICMLKHSLLKNRGLYNEPYVGGRYYWGKSEYFGIEDQNYKPQDFNDYKNKIYLSGTNWIGVPDVSWIGYSKIDKLFDISAMFQHPHPECHEFNLKPSQDYYYNKHREPVLDIISKSPYVVAKLVKGKRVPYDQYQKMIAMSKVVIAPFGYGEMAPRDIESAMFGSILVKPDMKHVDTYPNIYEEKVTYVPCKHDYSNLDAILEYYCDHFEEVRDYLVNNFRKQYDQKYYKGYLVDYTEQLFKKLNIL